ncbi:MAG: D-2-hydroxyacid dehydrogenase [Oscillospiraceae bacterium]
MEIVVLDGYAENPGDLSWKGFEALGNVTLYDRTPKELINQRIGKAECVITNKTPITEETFLNCKNIKYVGALSTGYNVIDIESAKKRNIVVTNIPAYGTIAVAQHTIGLLLEICNHIGEHSESVKNGEWTACKDFCYWKYPLIELMGKTLGIIGFGSIGQATAKIALALGMKVVYYSRNLKEFENAKRLELDELFKMSDVISLHCPLSESTEKMICKQNIDKMKDGVIILNTARGGLIVDDDLAAALDSGKVYMAGLDVITTEPILANNPLLNSKKCIITPHIAWAAHEARQRLMEIAVKNLNGFIIGNLQNVV